MFVAIIICSLVQMVIDFPFAQLNMTFKHLPYFMLGYYLGKESFSVRFSFLVDSALLFVAIILYFVGYHIPSSLSPLFSYITAICFIIPILSITGQYKLGEGNKYYSILKKDGMGIFLWHVIIIYLSYYLELFSSSGNSIQIILISSISLLLSIVLTWVTRKAGLKFMLGEA